MSVVSIEPYASNSAPPPEVVEILERGLVEVVRRVEIYEADTFTRWNPSAPDADAIRLIEGSVTVDYNSDERRKLDLTLDNIDRLLRPNPNSGLWYDKVIKVFRGVRYSSHDLASSFAIIEAQGAEAGAGKFAQQLASMDYENSVIMLGKTDPSELSKFSHIASVMSTNAPSSAAINAMSVLFEMGKTIVTVGVGSTASQMPHYSSTESTGTTVQWGIEPVTTDTPTAGSFTTEAAVPSVVGHAAAGVQPVAQALALGLSGGPSMVTAAIARNPSGGYWIDIRLPNLDGTQSRRLLRAALNYAKNFQKTQTWETQLGEFFIDAINASNFPNSVKITARDGTKKLIKSKLSKTSTFAAGYSLKDFVAGQAALAGIPVSKMRFDIGDEVLPSEMSFSRGTSRWDMVKSALESFNYERFFDGFGNFVVRKFLDPTASPVSWTFGTGPKGNLVQFDKSINDSRIFNHIIVTSEPTSDESNPIGYFGEAILDDISAPTHPSRLGDLVETIDAPWLSSDAECVTLAQERLKVSALESYELNFSSIYYPWLEAGEIIRILDPEAFDFEPDRFLMDSISYPLALGPMSATGKRVTFVGSSGGTAGEEME